jgi:cytochrome c5
MKERRRSTTPSRRLTRTILGVMGIVLVGVGSLQLSAQRPSESVPASSAQSVQAVSAPATQYKAVVEQYCVTCHSERVKAAGLVLSKEDVSNPAARAEVFEKMVLKLRGRAMPPAGAPRPDDSTYDSFVAYLETELDRAAAVGYSSSLESCRVHQRHSRLAGG